MAFIELEDMSGTAEIVVFPRTFAKSEQWLDTYHVFIVKGAVDLNSVQQCKIKANDLVPIDLVLQEWPNIERVMVTLPETVTQETLELFKKSLISGKIPLELLFEENEKKLRLSCKERVALDMETVQSLQKEHGVKITCSL